MSRVLEPISVAFLMFSRYESEAAILIGVDFCYFISRMFSTTVYMLCFLRFVAMLKCQFTMEMRKVCTIPFADSQHMVMRIIFDD